MIMWIVWLIILLLLGWPDPVEAQPPPGKLRVTITNCHDELTGDTMVLRLCDVTVEKKGFIPDTFQVGLAGADLFLPEKCTGGVTDCQETRLKALIKSNLSDAVGRMTQQKTTQDVPGLRGSFFEDSP